MAVPHHKEEESPIARSFKSFVAAVKKPPSRGTWLLLVVGLLVAVLVGSWFWFTSSAGAASSERWLKKWQTPETVDALERFAEDPNEKGSLEARFALLQAAELRMQQINQIGSSDPSQDEEARKNVETARAAYEKLVLESGDNPALMRQSLVGAAKANEVLGHLDAAKKYYQQLARDYPNTALGGAAEPRAKALDDKDERAVIEAVNGAFAPPAVASK